MPGAQGFLLRSISYGFLPRVSYIPAGFRFGVSELKCYWNTMAGVRVRWVENGSRQPTKLKIDMCIYITNILANALSRKLWKSNDRWFEEWLNFAQKNRWWCFAIDLMLVWFPAPYKSFLEVSIYLKVEVRHESLWKSSVAQEEKDSFGNKKIHVIEWMLMNREVFFVHAHVEIRHPRPKT